MAVCGMVEIIKLTYFGKFKTALSLKQVGKELDKITVF